MEKMNKQQEKKSTFKRKLHYIIYKTRTWRDIKKLFLNKINIDKIKKNAPQDAYWFVLENKKSLLYIIDGEIKTTDRMNEEDRYFDREANEVEKAIWRCKKYVVTRIKNLFLKYDKNSMKMI